MAKYNVEIIENLSKVVEVEAASYEEAELIVEEMYDNSEVILDYEDKEDTNFKPYPSQKIRGNFSISVDFDKNKRNVFIATKSSSRASYPCKTEDDLRAAINTYISNYIELEPVNAIKEKKSKDKDRDGR